MHQKSNVNDVAPNNIGRVGWFRVRRGLHKLHPIAFRIIDAKGLAAIGVAHDFRGSFPSLLGQIRAQSFGTVGVIAGVIEAVNANPSADQWQYLDELRCIDRISNTFWILRIGLARGSDDLRIVMIRGLRVGGINRDMRDAGDLGSWTLGSSSGWGQGKRRRKGKHPKRHGRFKAPGKPLWGSAATIGRLALAMQLPPPREDLLDRP